MTNRKRLPHLNVLKYLKGTALYLGKGGHRERERERKKERERETSHGSVDLIQHETVGTGVTEHTLHLCSALDSIG